ncbi:MAG: restriction endonuclease subunit S [Chitinophagales bacterium]|nr:restriction endonuclease subunit S [Chitinophagales bacterium]
MAATKNTKAFYNTEIPSDWVIKKLGDCCMVKGEYGINAPAVEFSEDLPAYLRITDIDDSGNYSLDKKASVGDSNYEQFVLNNGDIVFARTGATVGKTYLYKPTDGILVFAGFLIRFRTNEKLLTPQHLKYFTETKHYWDWVKTVSMRSGQPGINAEEYASLKIPLPPLPEQKAIARVLSTADAVNHTTEKLIAQKELRKKWLMQQLLTGKKRLKGFDGEWKEKKLSDLFERVTRKNDEGNTNVVTISAQRGFVRQTDFFNKTVASEILDNYFLVKKGEFCYNKSYSNGYPWGATKRLNDFDKAVVTTLYICFGIKDEKKTNPEFFEQYFEANLLDKGLTKIAHEGGRAHGLLNVTPSDFFSLKVTIPSYKEQTAIAQVLQAADKEISLLKAKAEKLREQKKGLMQQLLTGKVRLKINKE